MWFFRFAIILLEFLFIFYYTAVVFPNMDIQTAKAQAAAAQQDAIKAEELGKAAAMTAKWEQEKVKAVEVTKAQQAYEVAALAAKEAVENAKKVKHSVRQH